jgi:hypothetical protein
MGGSVADESLTGENPKKADLLEAATLETESPMIVVCAQQELHIAWRFQSSCRCCVLQSVFPADRDGFGFACATGDFDR